LAGNVSAILVTGGGGYVGSHAAEALRKVGWADAHVAALEALEREGGSAVYNLGNGRAFSVLEVISSVERVTDRKAPRLLSERRPGDPGVLYASNARARAGLCRKPRLSELDRIVGTAWRWHQAHQDGFEG
jgi:UDP-glucose 4-epimerase